MTPIQALQVLQNVLIAKVGLTKQDMEIVLQAWSVLEQFVTDRTAQKIVTVPDGDKITEV